MVRMAELVQERTSGYDAARLTAVIALGTGLTALRSTALLATGMQELAMLKLIG